MMSSTPKKKYAPVDKDMALMENLEKGPPVSYTAWTPSDDSSSSGLSDAAAKLEGGSGSDGGGAPSPASSLAAAAKSLDDDDLSFLQVHRWESVRTASAAEAAAAAEAAEATRVTQAAQASAAVTAPSTDSVSQLIMDTASEEAEDPEAAVASAVLGSYAEVLGSKPLRQLADTHMTLGKLRALWERLQAANPSSGSTAMMPASSGTPQEANAEQWCLRFQQNSQGTAPTVEARARANEADDNYAAAAAYSAASTEEREAWSQLLKTAGQDGDGLASLLGAVQQAYDPTALSLSDWEEQSAMRNPEAGSRELQLYATASHAESALHLAHTEISDAIKEAARKRAEAEQRRQAQLTKAAAEAQDASQKMSQFAGVRSQAQTSMDAAQKSLTGVEAMCDNALSAADRQRHAIVREMRAVRAALAVMGNKGP